MSRNFRCTVGVAIVWGLFVLNIVFGCFVVQVFFGGLNDMYFGWLKSGWDVQFTYGIAKVFCSLLGLLAFFGIAAGLIKAEGWLCRWKAGKA